MSPVPVRRSVTRKASRDTRAPRGRPSPLAVVFARRRELRPAAAAVLESVARLADRDGPSWGETYARVSTIGRRCQLSERQARRVLAGLVAGGYLERQDRPGRTTLWRVLPPPTSPPAEAPAEVVAGPPEGLFAASEGGPGWPGTPDILAGDQRFLPEPPHPTASQREPLPPPDPRGGVRERDRAAPVGPELDPTRHALAARGLGDVAPVLRPWQAAIAVAAQQIAGPRALAEQAVRGVRAHGLPATWAAWIDPWLGLAERTPLAAVDDAGPPPDPQPPARTFDERRAFLEELFERVHAETGWHPRSPVRRGEAEAGAAPPGYDRPNGPGGPDPGPGDAACTAG